MKLYNRLDNSPQSRWAEQVHMAREEFKMQSIGARPSLEGTEQFFRGMGDIAALRVERAYAPVLEALGRLELRFAAVAVAVCEFRR